jgi:transcriptional regulator with XRE-family HTH domain
VSERLTGLVINVVAMSAETLSAAIGLRLRELRLRAALTLPDLSKKVGLSASALRRIEAGAAEPSVSTLNELAGHLGTTLGQLVHAAKTQAARREASALRGPEEIGRAILNLPDGTDKLTVVAQAAIRLALEQCDDNQSAAAHLLGMNRRAMMRRLGRSSKARS